MVPTKEVKVAAIAAIIVACAAAKKKKRKKCWTREWIQRRDQGRGTLSLVQNELRLEDQASYKNFLRMPEEAFNKLLGLVGPRIQRQNTNMREAISPEMRLQVTLRFLATGETYVNLMYSTRIPFGTLARIIPETCIEIYASLKEEYLKVPDTAEEWSTIARNFEQVWNFPNCLGALDGKHVQFAAPRSSGSHYYNYKGTNSLILLGLVDANYKFIYIDVGTNGRASDGGVYQNSTLFAAMQQGALDIPPPRMLPETNLEVPYVMVGDDAFPLSSNLMKPYGFRGLTRDQKIFNYRLSRARCVVENAFGIMANVFRVLLTKMRVSPEKVESIILATCALHNFLIEENRGVYLSPQNVDTENLEDGNLQSGVWRNDVTLARMERQCGNRAAQSPINVRNTFKEYFNGTGSVSWQDRCIDNYRY